MAFKPSNTAPANNGVNVNLPKIDWSAINKQVKSGSRPARISLIVDLGQQKREPSSDKYNPADEQHVKSVESGKAWLEDDGKGGQLIRRERQPVQQVAVFADLGNDVVDYGGNIGEQPYRILINKSFKGELTGIDFVGGFAYDDKGNRIESRGFTFHQKSRLYELAVATEQRQIIAGSGDDNMDISQLLGQAFMAKVEKTEGDKATYVNFKGATDVGTVEDAEGNEVPRKVKQLSTPAVLITFDDITEDQVKYLRYEVIKKIQQALNFEGSNMEAVLKVAGTGAKTASNNENDSGTEASETTSAKTDTKPAATKTTATKAAKQVKEPEPEDDVPDSPSEDDYEDDIVF